MKANTLRFSIILLTALTLAACTTPTDEPTKPVASETYTPIPTKTPTATKTPTPTATQTETPTEVPISYEIPMTADGKIDIDNIVNVVPESKKDREAYFAKVKAYLVAEQAKKYPDGKGIPQCLVGIDTLDIDPATQVRLSCYANDYYSGVISPGLLSKDNGGNVVMTFLANFRGTDGKWTQRRLVNVVVFSDEMSKRLKTNFGVNRSTDFFWGLPWGVGNDLIITFGGNMVSGYVGGMYPNMEEQIKRNQQDGVGDEIFRLTAPPGDGSLKIDGVIFPAFNISLQ